MTSPAPPPQPARPLVRLLVRVLLVLFAGALSTLFFGLCLPFFLLGVKALPSLGVGGVVYVFAGGTFGLLFGLVSTGVSLGRAQTLVSRYYVGLLVTLAVLTLAYYVAYMNIEALQHV
jgi:hypothetical protein